jgi:ABC-2 type transport system permease protein
MTAASGGGGRGGSIYDLGYRGYEGARLGRRGAIGALLTHSLRTAYGLGRSTRSKIMPVGVLVLAVLPSLLALGILALIGQFGEAGEAIEAIQPVRYATLFPFTATLVFLFCASQAPELFGRDQRWGVMPLYFARAVGRLDYAAARFLGLWLATLVLVLAPQLLLLVGRVMVSPDLADGLAEELPSVPSILAIALIVSVMVSAISAAAASLSPRRSYATVAIIAIFLVANITATVLVELDIGLGGQLAVLLSPADVLDGVNAFLFGTQPDNSAVAEADLPDAIWLVAAGAWTIGSLAVLGWRYRTLEA